MTENDQHSAPRKVPGATGDGDGLPSEIAASSPVQSGTVARRGSVRASGSQPTDAAGDAPASAASSPDQIEREFLAALTIDELLTVHRGAHQDDVELVAAELETRRAVA